MTVLRGEAVSIVGPNGAGKTTFLRQLTTELRPTSGEIEIFGVNAVKDVDGAKSSMGVTPQEAGLFETLTVREHLELFGRLKGLDKRAAGLQTGEILERLEIAEEAKKKVGELSGGQRRRVLIGLPLLGKPPLLILDEPTTGLDPSSRRAVWRLLKQVNLGGTTVILSTHYMEEAEHLSWRVAFISDGRIVLDDKLSLLRARFPRKYRLTFHNGGGPLEIPHVEFFDGFRSAEAFIKAKQISEYQLATASLEDFYFSVVGGPMQTNGDTARGDD